MPNAEKNCIQCGNPFYPSRSDQDFDRRECARKFRSTKIGPLPGRRRLIPPQELATFNEGMRRAKAPRHAIGYKLYCSELLVWLPLPGTQRFDGSFPKHDYFRLRPLEIPRVPLATNYQLAWVFPGGIVQELEHKVFVSFPARMSRAGELGRRLRAHTRAHREVLAAGGTPRVAVLPEHSELLLGHRDEGDAGPEGETEDDA